MFSWFAYVLFFIKSRCVELSGPQYLFETIRDSAEVVMWLQETL